MADSVARGGENCANEEIGQDKRVSEVSEVKGQGAAVDRSSEETNSTTATPVSYSREGYLESSGNYSAAGGCFNPTVEALQVRVHYILISPAFGLKFSLNRFITHLHVDAA